MWRDAVDAVPKNSRLDGGRSRETGVRVAVLEWNAGGQETIDRLVGSVSAPGEETLGPAWYALLL